MSKVQRLVYKYILNSFQIISFCLYILKGNLINVSTVSTSKISINRTLKTICFLPLFNIEDPAAKHSAPNLK